MKTLALDSSTGILSVCVTSETSRLSEICLDIGLAHAEMAIDLIRAALEYARTDPEELDLLAVSAGPGSFTGLRIGFSAIKGMSLALARPFVSVSSLDAFAFGLDHFDGIVVPLVNGKKSRHFASIYEHGKMSGESMDIELDGLARLLEAYPKILFTGPDALDAKELTVSHPGWTLDEDPRRSRAFAVAKLAEKAFESRGADPVTAEPYYMRPSEAEEPKGDKSKG